MLRNEAIRKTSIRFLSSKTGRRTVCKWFRSDLRLSSPVGPRRRKTFKSGQISPSSHTLVGAVRVSHVSVPLFGQKWM